MCIKAHNVLQAHRAKVYGSLKHATNPSQNEASSDLVQEMLLWELTNEIKDITFHALYLAAIDNSLTATELLQCFQSPEQTIHVDDTLSEGDMALCNLDDVWIEDDLEDEGDSETDPAAHLSDEQALHRLPRSYGSLKLDLESVPDATDIEEGRRP